MLKIKESIIEKLKTDIERFNIKETVERAKRQFENFNDIKSINETETFDAEQWVFRELIYDKPIYFEFRKFIPFVSFNKKINLDEFILALKSWTMFNLNTSSPSFSYNQFNHLYSICVLTKGFNTNFDQLNRLIENQQLYSNSVGVARNSSFSIKIATSETVKRFINSLIEFSNFYPNLYIEPNVMHSLSISAQKLKNSHSSRKIPKPEEFLNFKDCLDQFYFESISKKTINHILLIKYFPLIIWWDLTSIIPMRPSEFCMIRRDCLNNKTITFPRFKQRRNNKDSRENIVYDSLPIAQNLIEKIKYYKTLTTPYGHTESLLSFPAYVELSLKNVKKTVDYSKRYFTAKHLRKLIDDFYEDIVIGRYQLKIKEKIKPGDLRHTAIISMMLQGYDRVEIERLAGHFSPETQYSYLNHMHFFVDTEIQALSNQFALHSNNKKSPLAYEKYDEILDKAIFNELAENKSNRSLIELEVGFCKDPTMSCPTFNWNYTGCYFCKNWGISFLDIQEKREIIIDELSIIYDDLHRKINYLAGLYNINQMDEFGEINPNLHSELKITSREIEDDKNAIAKLNYLLGRSPIHD